MSKGLQIPTGHAHADVIKEAWKEDQNSLTLKAMPRITKSHTQPNSFEKMRVNLAFQLFSEEVLKGLFFYKEHLNKTFRAVQPTEELVKLMEKLIFVMTSRTPSKGLRPNSPSAQFLDNFIEFLAEWEQHAAEHGGGFLSPGTACGLRVTLKSTLSLLCYLSSSLGLKYLLTANLSQDKMENVFGIVRQSFGCNDHPSPEQFLIIINSLSFYSLARSPKNGNSPEEVVTALLGPSDLGREKSAHISAVMDEILDDDNLERAEYVLRTQGLLDHKSCIEKHSDSRLVFYIAGYVVRKSLKRSSCLACASSLCILPVQAECNDNASFTREFDHAGLIYTLPSRSRSSLRILKTPLLCSSAEMSFMLEA